MQKADKIRELHGGLVSQTSYFEADNKQYVFQVGNSAKIYKKKKWVYYFLNQTVPVIPLKGHLMEQGNELIVAYQVGLTGIKTHCTRNACLLK